MFAGLRRRNSIRGEFVRSERPGDAAADADPDAREKQLSSVFPDKLPPTHDADEFSSTDLATGSATAGSTRGSLGIAGPDSESAATAGAAETGDCCFK